MAEMKFDELRQDVKLYLKHNRLLQADFAYKAGITSTILSRFLTKPDHKPDIENVVRMIKFLGKSVDYYLGEGQQKIVYYENDPTPVKIKAIIYSDDTLSQVAKEALSQLMAASYSEIVSSK